MKHSRLLLFLFLTAFFQYTSGQKKVLLKNVMAPNKVYKAQLTNQTEMEMTVKGDSAAMAEMETSGMKSPITMLVKQDMLITTRTGAKRPDKKIPLTATYDKIDISTSIAGNETNQHTNPLANVEIQGTTMGDGKISIDTITGNIDDVTKASIRTMVNNIQGNAKLPEKELAIGDSFEQDMPLVVPIADMQIKMKIHVKSTLKEIKDNKAIFDLQQDISMDMSMMDNNGSANGSGKGTGSLIFDMKNKMLERTDSDIHYQLNMNMTGMTISAKCYAKQGTSYSVE